MKFQTAKRFFNQLNQTVYLYSNIWKEHTTALLHSNREVDKTTFALSVAEDIAGKGRQVLYVNTTGNLDGLKSDSESLFIFTPEFESIDDKSDYADLVFAGIEEAIRTTSIRTFVIDSVSRIAALSFGRNASVAYVMKRLVALQVKCKLSLLVLADRTTKTATNALISLADIYIGLDLEAEVPADKSERPGKLYKDSYTTLRQTAGMVTDRDAVKDLCRGIRSENYRIPVCRPSANHA